MELRSRVFKVALATVTGLVAIIGSQPESEASGYSYLCTSIPSACEYAPSSAPKLAADVCWDGSVAILKGVNDCPTGTWPYWVDAGEIIDPNTSEVQPYISLDDACDLGYCVPKDPNDPPGEAGPMCCNPSTGTCTATDSSCPASQIAVWCPDGQEASQSQNGEWECHES
jgi:hypothetical protein